MPGQQRDLTLRFLAEPTDVNYGGKVHGGIVMKWIDQAGYAAAVGWSGRYSVTVAVGGIRFVAPVRISDLVAVSAKLIHTGNSSMHFAIEVRARDPMGGDWRLCTDRVIGFVALGILVHQLAECGPALPEPAHGPIDARSGHAYLLEDRPV
mgnify:CR=1 FL=1